MNVCVFNIGSICINGKNYSEHLHSIKKTGKNLMLKQMFDISEKLIIEQSGEIFGVSPINWESSSWKHVSLVIDEEDISLSHAKVYVFSDSVLCLGKINQNPTSNSAWEEKLSWFKTSSQYRALDTIDGEPMDFEWNIFPGFNTLQLSQEVKELLGIGCLTELILILKFKFDTLTPNINSQTF